MTSARVPALSRRSSRVGHKFALAVAVLVVAVLAVAAVGLLGVNRTHDRANRLYDHNVQTVLNLGELLDGVHEVELAALDLLIASTSEEHARLNAALDVDLLPHLEESIDIARAVIGDPDHAAALDTIAAGLAEFGALRSSGKLDLVETEPGADQRVALDLTRIFDIVETAAQELFAAESEEAAAAHAAADDSYRSTVLLLGASILFALIVAVVVVRLLSRNIVPRVQRYSDFAGEIAAGRQTGPLEVSGRDELAELGAALNSMVSQRAVLNVTEQRQAEFVDTLQVTSTEEEAHELIKRHLERSLQDTSVVVLQRNNSANRLEAATSMRSDDELAGRLVGAEPRSCLSLRFARTHREGEAITPLLGCELCQRRGTESTCEPLLVGGEVIGSVLVSHPEPLDITDDVRIKTSVAQAAPVLANLRNLALAEFRANNDSLTGLPNKRATDDTLKRMVAQANRTLSPLTAIMMDLDHFKRINDQYGHGKGDEVLAAVGAAVRESLRASDFAGRFGGEEFLVLLPDTGLEAAKQVAEKIRLTVAGITMPGIEREITVSLGLAALLEHAGNADGLVREADHALYAAKSNGRNRTVVSENNTPVAVTV